MEKTEKLQAIDRYTRQFSLIFYWKIKKDTCSLCLLVAFALNYGLKLAYAYGMELSCWNGHQQLGIVILLFFLFFLVHGAFFELCNLGIHHSSLPPCLNISWLCLSFAVFFGGGSQCYTKCCLQSPVASQWWESSDRRVCWSPRSQGTCWGPTAITGTYQPKPNRSQGYKLSTTSGSPTPYASTFF